MNAILGRITAVRGAVRRLTLDVSPLTLLPERREPADWLKARTITIEREAADRREVGDEGDTVVLGPDESAPYLRPLLVTPDVARDEIPDTLELRVRSWPERPADWTVECSGRRRSGGWDADGDGWTSRVDLSAMFDLPPALPVAIDVSCGPWRAACTVLDGHAPAVVEIPGAERTHSIANRWYEIGVASGAKGGAIASLRERVRDADHLRAPTGVVQRPFELAGHRDLYKAGPGDWSDKLHDATTTAAGARRETGALRLTVAADVDTGDGIHTRAAFHAYDDWPLLLVERDFDFAVKKPDDDPPKTTTAPIDDLKAVQLGFVSGAVFDGATEPLSRVLCRESGRVSVTRPAETGEAVNHWTTTIDGGWVMVDHPLRRETLLYLFDPAQQPHLWVWRGTHTIKVNPYWPHRPVRTGSSAGFALCMSAGEAFGASGAGVWVACRARTPSGRLCVGIVARLDQDRDAVAAVTAGATQEELALTRVDPPGVGAVWCGAIEIDADAAAPFDAMVGGIAAWRTS